MLCMAGVVHGGSASSREAEPHIIHSNAEHWNKRRFKSLTGKELYVKLIPMGTVLPLRLSEVIYFRAIAFS
jgi:hypothetical protein